jgi:hypothetical protein
VREKEEIIMSIDELQQLVIGQPYSEGISFIDASEFVSRIAEIDGDRGTVIVTDKRQDRLNLTVTEGIITAAVIG